MTKGTKIEGSATVIRTGTATVNGPQECPFVDVSIDGNEYRWQSENAGWGDYSDGQIINIRAFVRPNGRLYKVTAMKEVA
jgi:hypothetical protein